MVSRKVLLSWSSGKDSAWSLHVLRARGVEVVGLLTSINMHFQRVAMHGTRHVLLKAQSDAARLPLWEIPLPWPCSNEIYERAMSETCAAAVRAGVSAIAFGDLFLEDVRRYREDRLRGTGLEPIFPLWGRDTTELIAEMIGYDLLRRLPHGVDPCGENGEFHTFAYSGPMFDEPIPIVRGETVTRDGFLYADVLPRSTAVA
jgi:diphthamide synthase (EF-2-diphthine--ammonia ligase)